MSTTKKAPATKVRGKGTATKKAAPAKKTTAKKATGGSARHTRRDATKAAEGRPAHWVKGKVKDGFTVAWVKAQFITMKKRTDEGTVWKVETLTGSEYIAESGKAAGDAGRAYVATGAFPKAAKKTASKK